MKNQIGVDIFDMQRMQKALTEDNPIYLHDVFSPEEIAKSKEHSDTGIYFATRFALKEAAFKSLHTSWTDKMEWNQIVVSSNKSSAPHITFKGEMKKKADEIGVKDISASISYDKGLAFAAVIVEIGMFPK